MRMKLITSALLSLLLPLFAAAAEKSAQAESVIPKDYPMQTCVVTGDTLSDHEPVAYRHQEAGKPDRTVVLCCEHCIADFKREPARYLKVLDEAAAAKAHGKAPAPEASQKKKDAGHHH